MKALSHKEAELIVGVPRWLTQHVARVTTAGATILHSQECVAANPDLRKCPYSEALNWPDVWLKDWLKKHLDVPVLVELEHDQRGRAMLIPGQHLKPSYVPTITFE